MAGTCHMRKLNFFQNFLLSHKLVKYKLRRFEEFRVLTVSPNQSNAHSGSQIGSVQDSGAYSQKPPRCVWLAAALDSYSEEHKERSLLEAHSQKRNLLLLNARHYFIQLYGSYLSFRTMSSSKMETKPLFFYATPFHRRKLE